MYQQRKLVAMLLNKYLKKENFYFLKQIPNGKTRDYKVLKCLRMEFVAFLMYQNIYMKIIPLQVSVVIQDLLSTELWQNKVFPLLLEMDIQQNSSLPIYMAVSNLQMLSFSLSHLV